MSNRCSFHKLNCPVNFPRLLASISHELVPPVGNKVIHDGHIKVMVVGGPNHRTDYHVEMGEELFHQITGHMDLFVVVDGLHKCIRIEEGQYFLLPAGIPHSPQRYLSASGYRESWMLCAGIPRNSQRENKPLLLGQCGMRTISTALTSGHK